MRYKHLTKDQIATIVAAYSVNQNVAQLAPQLGFDKQRIRSTLKRLGLFDKSKTKRDSACNRNRELVLKLGAAREFPTAIARKIGTTARHVRAFLRQELPGWKSEKDFRGSRNANWKGGRIIDKDGYVQIRHWTHPHRDRHNLVREHRLVMEQMLGRYLLPEEVVHHKNKNKQDNRPENLELFSKNSEHLKHELTGHVPKWSPEGVANILAGVRRGAVTRRNRNLARKAQDALQSP